MNKAIFLDRDGVINYERGTYTSRVEDFIINPGIPEAIKMLRDNDFLVIIITNQGGIAKKIYSEQDVLEMHIKLCMELKKINTTITDIYFCPHHNSTGKCLCRKPESLMLEKAVASYNISKSDSLLIGDSERDIIAAEKIGIKGIKVDSNQSIVEICKQIVSDEAS